MSSATGPGLHRWADAVEQPWRNGGGVTRQLASSPEGALDDVDWRISIADVTAPGDFSRFPGVDRTIVLVDGAEMILTVDGTPIPLTRWRPFRFDGGRPVTCALPDGPTRALNVMTRSGRYRAEVTVVDVVAASAEMSTRATTWVIPVAGRITVTGPDELPLVLDRFDLFRAPAGAPIAVTGDGTVARIGISPVE